MFTGVPTLKPVVSDIAFSTLSGFQDEMDRACLPEMQRCPLEAIVLKCKKLMEDHCPLQLISSALDPPDLSNYEKTILKLKEVGFAFAPSMFYLVEVDKSRQF